MGDGGQGYVVLRCWHLQPSWHQLHLHSNSSSPSSISSLEVQSVEFIEALWAIQSNSAKPMAEVQHIQKAWDGPVAANHRALLLARAVSDVNTARLLAASSPHSGDWLHAPPTTAVGLRLSDDDIRVAVAHRLGYKP